MITEISYEWLYLLEILLCFYSDPWHIDKILYIMFISATRYIGLLLSVYIYIYTYIYLFIFGTKEKVHVSALYRTTEY